HGEGRAELSAAGLAALERAGLVAARFVDGRGEVAAAYPANPNGSPGGVAALTSADGRITIMMPHPERVFRTVQLSWHPPGWGEASPWLRMFHNARAWGGWGDRVRPAGRARRARTPRTGAHARGDTSSASAAGPTSRRARSRRAAARGRPG